MLRAIGYLGVSGALAETLHELPRFGCRPINKRREAAAVQGGLYVRSWVMGFRSRK